ncbi:V-type ATP synthase subunit A [Desulfurobacterium atlanticum]|uniref:V-type ATP synthase alpha chain n=1 Tax=Desulfurobacterium atlanticum TaxID=240169 RepID=A0A238XR24_9BACT|nr:V-type ATP synthase subunit A [Desulfurobacterium atlanticum]SNR61486.1 V/A-type H+-transporting ATPase subunit A [Desulfurobacterium atlanticum]
MAKITYISGPIVKAELEGESPKLLEVAFVGEDKLIGEVVAIQENTITIQVYETTDGLKLKEPVKLSGEMLKAVLAPGLLGSIYDGIERPLEKLGERIERGKSVFPVSKDKRWHFVPLKRKGEKINEGEIFGYVTEGNIKHFLTAPLGIKGTIDAIEEGGEYTVEEELLTLDSGQTLTMVQEWPVRFPRKFRKRLNPDIPLITGQRIIDFLFPIAKGGTASIPGGFGTGKTILQQTLAKWCDADIIVYIGCGERGNEMTEVLEEFPELEDPRTGKKLIERTILIANTSNMPVSAREASIYLGITIAEYFRDMGYHVALMADSTSRWAEAMRELSTRMGELPIEEGFPAYLSSRIAGVYERAGFVETLSGSVGSLTIIGAVSPPGGDFSEPVTRHTRRFTSVFWALDKELANARFYPAINYTQSYSAYGGTVRKWWEEIYRNWYELRSWMMKLLQEDDKLQRIVKLLGSEALPEEQKLIVEISHFIKEVFLQQNAFDPIDAYCPPERQIKIAEILKTLYQWWEACLKEKGIPIKILKEQKVVEEILRLRFVEKIPENIIEKIEETYKNLLKSYSEWEK